MRKITVIDAMPGKYKTTWAMQNMVGMRDMGFCFIYITPYLDEVDRVVDYLKENNVSVSVPSSFKGKGSKSEHLKKLIAERKNIITTHALFDRIDGETLELFRTNQYVLYLDEVHEVVKKHYMSEYDLALLKTSNYIKIQDDCSIDWIAEDYDGRFEEFKNLCNLGALFYYADSVYIWTFPIEIFKYVHHTFILTHMFEGQIQSSYYQMYNMEYEKKYVKRLDDGVCTLIDYKLEYDERDRENIKDKINIYEGHLNYDKAINLSSSFFNRSDASMFKVIKNNMYNYFSNIVKGSSEENMWTTLKDYKNVLKSKGYTKGFVPLNARATNKYKHKTNLAYIYNRYINPIDRNFFEMRNIKVNEDLYALSELIQWIFRSAIREGKPINIYIPSLRMRKLLKTYLDKIA